MKMCHGSSVLVTGLPLVLHWLSRWGGHGVYNGLYIYIYFFFLIGLFFFGGGYGEH